MPAFRPTRFTASRRYQSPEPNDRSRSVQSYHGAVSSKILRRNSSLLRRVAVVGVERGMRSNRMRSGRFHRTHFAGSRRHRWAIGMSRPLPKAFSETRMVGAAWRRLNSFVSTSRRMRCDELAVEACGGDLVDFLPLLDVELEDPVEDVVRRERVLVGLVRAQLGGRRLGHRRLGDDLALAVDPARDAIDHGLVHVAEERQAAGHVAVERAVADGELGLVAGGQHQRAGAVGPGHEDVAADARLDVLVRRCRTCARRTVSSIAVSYGA